MNIKIENNNLIISGEEFNRTLNLKHALKVSLFDRVLDRKTIANEFVISQIFPAGPNVRIHLSNDEYGLIIPVILKVENNILKVKIRLGEAVEQAALQFRLMGICLLPELMESKVGDEGHFIIPAYSGCLVQFKEHPPCIDRTRIYMEQAEWEKFSMMNCFASKVGGQGILSIVHQGDFNCHVTTEINNNGTNRIYPDFGTRFQPGDLLPQKELEVFYVFTQGASSEYPEMAKSYRNYLINYKGVSPLKDRLDSNPVLKYSVNALRVKILMAVKTPISPDGQSDVQVYTTFKETEKIIDSMKAAGIDHAVITLVGWNLAGHDGAYPTKLPIEPLLGSIDDLTKLIKKAEKVGYQLVPHDNVTDAYLTAPDFDSSYITQTPDGSLRSSGIWAGGQAFKICPTVYLERYGYNFSKILELGFFGHYYMDAQSTVLWRCHSQSHPADEEQYAISLAKMTSIPRKMYGAVAVETPSAFSLPFIDEGARISHLITGYHDSWEYPETLKAITERGIPFYQIAVHGLITYQDRFVHHYRNLPGGVVKGLSAEIAFGARPSMEISYRKNNTGDYYQDSINEIKEAYNLAFKEMSGCTVEFIDEFIENQSGIYEVKYSNGISCKVNISCCKQGNLHDYIDLKKS